MEDEEEENEEETEEGEKLQEEEEDIDDELEMEEEVSWCNFYDHRQLLQGVLVWKGENDCLSLKISLQWVASLGLYAIPQFVYFKKFALCFSNWRGGGGGFLFSSFCRQGEGVFLSAWLWCFRFKSYLL